MWSGLNDTGPGLDEQCVDLSKLELPLVLRWVSEIGIGPLGRRRRRCLVDRLIGSDHPAARHRLGLPCSLAGGDGRRDDHSGLQLGLVAPLLKFRRLTASWQGEVGNAPRLVTSRSVKSGIPSLL